MREWLDGIAGPQYASAILWTVAALVLLVIVLILVRLVRGFSSGTFIAGGRNRKARLAVMDAAAVDSQRRLVLVRRDDVEHLILIGGPTDVVVEQNIVAAGTAHHPPTPSDREPVRTPQPRVVPQPSTPAERPRTVTPISQARPRPDPVAPIPAPTDARQAPAVRPIRPMPRVASDTVPPVARPPAPVPEVAAATPERAAAAISGIRLVEPEPSPAAVAPAVRVEPAAVPPAATVEPPKPAEVSARPEPPVIERDFDAALGHELETASDTPSAPTPKAADESSSSLEDEMKRLLGELSGGGGRK